MTMSFAPVTAVAIVAPTVIRTGSQSAFVWIAIQGSAAMSSRTWTGRIDCSEGVDEADPLGRAARSGLASLGAAFERWARWRCAGSSVFVGGQRLGWRCVAR